MAVAENKLSNSVTMKEFGKKVMDGKSYKKKPRIAVGKQIIELKSVICKSFTLPKRENIFFDGRKREKIN